MINKQGSTQFVVVTGTFTRSITVAARTIHDQDNFKYRISND